MDESTQTETGPPPERPRSSPAVWLLALVLFLPIVYVLSIGPVVAVAEKADVGKQQVKVFYAPVIWLHDHTFLKAPLEWYAQLWGWR